MSVMVDDPIEVYLDRLLVALSGSPREVRRTLAEAEFHLYESAAELEALANHEASLPISCVEGWSVGAHWRGVPLLNLVRRAGGDTGSRVHLASLQTRGAFGSSTVEGPQLAHALLATHLNGARLDIDHGYPLRLIAPNRAGVLNTKWLSRIVVS